MSVRKIAEYADLSVATVSRVLKGDTAVDPQTRDTVLRALSQFPFYPDLKSRKKRNRNFFIFLSPSHVNEKMHLSQINFFSRTLAGVKSHLDTANSRDGQERYLVLTSFRWGRIGEKLRELEELNFASSVGGVFITHTSREDQKALAEYAGRLKLYMLGRSREDIPNEGINFIYFDDVKAGQVACEHLLSRGHRRILVFSGPSELTYFEKRERAFRNGNGRTELDCRFVNTDEATPEAAYRLAREVFEKKEKDFSVVYVTAEVLLDGFLKCLDEKGIRVPEDLSLLSTNDYLVAYQHNPPVSVVRTPHFEIGRLAAMVALENCAFDFDTRIDYRLDVLLNDRRSVTDLGGAP